MAADKKDYQSVLGALVDYGTLASIINKLNRVLITTEDTDLKKLVEPVVARVDKVLRDPGSASCARPNLARSNIGAPQTTQRGTRARHRCPAARAAIRAPTMAGIGDLLP